MEDFEKRYAEVVVQPHCVLTARALAPIHERTVIGRTVMMFDGVERERLAAFGDTRTPSVADLFVAVIGRDASTTERLAA
jgi:ABC-2 type transport system ATP-binding protein